MTGLRAVVFCIAVAGSTQAVASEADRFVGRWGLAAYWEDKDAQAAIGWARQACGHPYVIEKSPSGNLRMHIADDPELKEIELRSSFGTQSLVPARGVTDDAGRHTRKVIARTDTSFTLEWADRGVAARYGRNVYVRCR